MKSKTLLLAAFFFFAEPLYSEVNVSPQFSFSKLLGPISVGPGQYFAAPFPGRPGDHYEFNVNLRNQAYRDVSVFFVDDIGLSLFKQGLPFRATGMDKGVAPFQFHAVRATTAPHYVLINNTYAALIGKRVDINVNVTGQWNPDEVKATKARLDKFYAELKQTFEFSDFDINVRPCGQANAFSDRQGNVTMCSEMIAQYMENPSALSAILLHELGHTLLNLWGIPGHNNEDMADEFATYALMQSPGGKKAIEDWIASFDTSNSANQALAMIVGGDRHSLSIQRVRNIRENLQNEDAFVRRWNKLVYSHTTEVALHKIANTPGPADDQKLAREVLETRAEKKVETVEQTSNRSVTESASAPITALPGCSKDTDCKGDRVCEKGVCINP